MSRGYRLSQGPSSTWEESVKEKGSVYGALSNPLHVGLDMLGFLPPADFLHSALYAAEGNPKMAGLHAAFGIPFIGDIGQYGKKIHDLATLPVKRLITNTINPSGIDYSSFALKDFLKSLKGKTKYGYTSRGDNTLGHSLIKGLKTTVLDDTPLWIKEISEGNPLYAPYLKGKGSPLKKIKLLTHKNAADWFLQRELWGLSPKNFKGSIKYADGKGVENIHKFNIKKGDVFKTNVKPQNITDLSFAKKGKFWKFNTNNKYAKKLDNVWKDISKRGKGANLKYNEPIVGDFGHDFKNVERYRIGPDGKMIPMYDRLWDTWNMTVNPPTLKEGLQGITHSDKIHANTTTMARHYLGKLLKLANNEVKLTTDIGKDIRNIKFNRHADRINKEALEALNKIK
tara:strand:+ start:8161 stop:9354 length:1194 start_codon:yes stop_codon:yes gene_type:complete